MNKQLAQAEILEIFDMSTPAIPGISHSSSAFASPVFSGFAMDTSDLHTRSINDDSLKTENTTSTFRTTNQPSSYCPKYNDPRRPQHYSQLNGCRNTNGTTLVIRSDVDFSSIKITADDENIRKLNNLRDYYKSQIRELPPLHKTAAAIISNVSSRAADASSNPPFQYNNTIEASVRTAPQSSGSKKGDIFNPKFNSTVNYDKGEIKCTNKSNERNVSKESQLSWRDYVSSENKSNSRSKTYRVERTKRSTRSNKSLQTMLTMENVSKLSEILGKVNGNETYRIDNKIDRSETFRLTKSVVIVPSSSNAYDTAEGCNYDLKLCRLKDGGVRASVINWLYRLHECTGGGDAVTVQCAVRFLDDLAALCEGEGEGDGEGTMPDTVLTCGVACYWVSSKLQSARVPGAASIARQCAGAFTAQQLVACERRVLAKLAFPSAPVVPADEVERLAYMWDIHEESGVTAVAHHLCCCALLHSHLAALTSIRLAAAALAVALQLLQPEHPLVSHLPLLRDEDGWSVALEQELERVCRAESAQECFSHGASALHTTTLRDYMTASNTPAYNHSY